MWSLDDSDPRAVGPYRIVGLLGRGGMGRVYLGMSRSGRRLAIKVIRSDLADLPEFRERFAHEVAAARAVSPLFTAAVVDADPHARPPWLATTFIDGISLDDRVSRDGPLSADEVFRLIAGLAEALASIHRAGLVHRDLKPGNVLLDESGPHVIDFGLALSRGATRMTTGIVIGTPSYMAPERLAGEEAGPPSDIFSLAATVFYAATGRELVSDASVYEQILQINEGRFDLSGLPHGLRPLITRCITHEPRQRPTAEELTRILMAMDAFASPSISPGRHRVSDPLPPLAPVAPVAFAPPKAPAPAGAPPAPVAAASPTAPRRWSRRAVFGLGGLGVLAATGGVVAWTGVLDDGAAANWSPAPTPTERVAGGILGTIDSGAGAPPGGPGRDLIYQRIVIDGAGRLITTDGPHITARDADGHELWSKMMPAGIVGTWRWGDDGVLATDGRQLCRYDSASGAISFQKDVVAVETPFAASDGADQTAVGVGQVVVGGDRAFVNLGTATVAMSRTGEKLWRHARTEPGASVPVAADPGHVLAQDPTATSAQVSLYEAATGHHVWTKTYETRAAPPPGGGPPGGGPNGPDGGDPAWQRSEGRLTEEYAVARSGSTVQVYERSGGAGGLSVVSELPVAAIEAVGGLAIVAADLVSAYDIKSRVRIWHAPVRGARLAVSTVPGEVLAVADQYAMGLDLLGGTQLWRTKLPVAGPVDYVAVNPHVAYVLLQAPDPEPGPGQPAPAPVDGPDVVVIALDTVS